MVCIRMNLAHAAWLWQMHNIQIQKKNKKEDLKIYLDRLIIEYLINGVNESLIFNLFYKNIFNFFNEVLIK